MNTPLRPQLSYKDAGVDIDSGNALVERIKPFAHATHRPGVMGGLGGFGALFKLSTTDYKQPILVSSTDGVGTKLRLAIELNRHQTIGQDLVAMCANDIIVQGAEPLFFLDYFATGKLHVETAATVVQGIAQGCQMAGMALVGGETAEMPDMYQAGDYDLAGFCVGVVEQSAIIDGQKVAPGDQLIGLASSGPHSNGYSLIRKILAASEASFENKLGDQTLADILLAPTRIYVKSILDVIAHHPIHALAHITGGGLLENIPRVLPAQTMVVIDKNAWTQPEIFHWLQEYGNVEQQEMYRTFNCGIGMVLIVSSQDTLAVIDRLTYAGEQAKVIGQVERSTAAEARVIIT